MRKLKQACKIPDRCSKTLQYIKAQVHNALVQILFCKLHLHNHCPAFDWTFPQDEGLDVISEGLDTLKNLAHDMNEVGLSFI